MNCLPNSRLCVFFLSFQSLVTTWVFGTWHLSPGSWLCEVTYCDSNSMKSLSLVLHCGNWMSSIQDICLDTAVIMRLVCTWKSGLSVLAPGGSLSSWVGGGGCQEWIRLFSAPISVGCSCATKHSALQHYFFQRLIVLKKLEHFYVMKKCIKFSPLWSFISFNSPKMPFHLGIRKNI